MSTWLQHAIVYACGAHAAVGQTYGGHPYSRHLNAVATLVESVTANEMVIAAAWLHDIIEDTKIEEAEIVRRFGPKVCNLVLLVSDEEGKNRKERKAKTHQKLANIADGSFEGFALVIKTADRLANVRQCVADNNDGLLSMYRREHEAFRTAAHRPGLCDALWEELDTLIKKSNHHVHR